jgi:hypothetical protein
MLAKLAQKYLCAPASSVASEQIFLTARIVFDYKRTKLLPKTAEKLIYINITL